MPLEDRDAAYLWDMLQAARFFRKNVTFLTFLTIFSFSIHPGRIKSLLP